jgi:hypothetical protein
MFNSARRISRLLGKEEEEEERRQGMGIENVPALVCIAGSSDPATQTNLMPIPAIPSGPGCIARWI